MATEQPQTLPTDQKTKTSTELGDMAVDEAAAPAVNGHAKPEENQTEESEKVATVNGKLGSPAPDVTKDAQNRQAFAANSSLPEQTPSKPPTEPGATEDTEMADVNGTAVDGKKEPSPTAEPEKENVAESSPKEATPPETPAATTGDAARPETTSEPVADDSMEVDASTELRDLTSSAQHGDSTQGTTSGDTPVASSEIQIQQPAEESKSDQPTEDNASSEARAASPSKVSRMREREDNDPDEPASKRAKTEDAATPAADSLVVANGPSPAPPASGAPPADNVPDDQVITPHQNKQIRAYLAGLKKTKNGLPFRQSVEKLWPVIWDDYRSKVEEPVDLSLFEAGLREEKYATYGEFKAKVELLYTNSLAFNGPDHGVTGASAVVRDQILTRLQEISKSEEPAKPEKGKAQPTRHAEPRSANQVRRQSQPRASQTTSSPKPKAEPAPPAASSTASAAPAFAIPPNGIPQIRRDSTREDGDRPKRPIHPPKSRDLDYSSSKVNRKKKMDPDQRFHDEVLNEVKKGKYFHMNQWFMEPVDPVALNIPTYFSVVKKPMDLGTMTRKNLDGHYKSSKEFEKDMRLIVHNAELFNGKEHDVAKLGRDLEELFKAELAKKDQWMAHHYPQDEPSTVNAPAASPERSIHESEDESVADGEEDTNEAIRSLQVRLNEEQDKLNTLLGSKKPELTMIEIQQQMVSMLQRKLVEEKTKFHSEERKSKAKKKSSKSKPKPGASAAAASGNKKASVSSSTVTKKSSGGHAKKPAPKKRAIGPLEKAVIEEGISNLDGNTLTKAVDIIKRDTGQNENDEGEMELDIESLTQEALGKLYDLIHKAHPHIRAALEKKPEYSSQAAAPEPEPKVRTSGPPKPKKNKPMNKHEQERKIEQLRELKAKLARQGSGSQEPPPTTGAEDQPAESSEEESSEEE
ncbi:hypothetical protein DL768_003591 [Monosporascus sp. mg162]|nr:hypothetical protein DL768_003591 [Monosporascus sp. mg162]